MTFKFSLTSFSSLLPTLHPLFVSVCACLAAVSASLEDSLASSAKATLQAIGAQEAALQAITHHTLKLKEAMEAEVLTTKMWYDGRNAGTHEKSDSISVNKCVFVQIAHCSTDQCSVVECTSPTSTSEVLIKKVEATSTVVWTKQSLCFQVQ